SVGGGTARALIRGCKVRAYGVVPALRDERDKPVGPTDRVVGLGKNTGGEAETNGGGQDDGGNRQQARSSGSFWERIREGSREFGHAQNGLGSGSEELIRVKSVNQISTIIREKLFRRKNRSWRWRFWGYIVTKVT